jgi:hypothetical protein
MRDGYNFINYDHNPTNDINTTNINDTYTHTNDSNGIMDCNLSNGIIDRNLSNGIMDCNLSNDFEGVLNSVLSREEMGISKNFGGKKRKKVARVETNSIELPTFTQQSIAMEDIKNTLKDTVETGRIGQGDISEQTFTTVNMDFEPITFHSIKYKIFPSSNKPIETSDLKQYCCECGKKLNKTDKFCSNCGTKV